jgi:hypothetical protein
MPCPACDDVGVCVQRNTRCATFQNRSASCERCVRGRSGESWVGSLSRQMKAWVSSSTCMGCLSRTPRATVRQNPRSSRWHRGVTLQRVAKGPSP